MSLLQFTDEPLKVIVAGSRTIGEYNVVKDILDSFPYTIGEVVCGCAKGVDLLGETWAIENKIDVEYFQADWSTYGRSAGPIRNRQMADYADALVLIWDGKSKGSANMLAEANKKNLIVVEIVLTS